MDAICSEPWDKSVQGLSDAAAQTQGTQHLKGLKIYPPYTYIYVYIYSIYMYIYTLYIYTLLILSY